MSMTLHASIDILNFTTGLETEVNHVISLYKFSMWHNKLENNRVSLARLIVAIDSSKMLSLHGFLRQPLVACNVTNCP